MKQLVLSLLILISSAGHVLAEDVYQTPETFIAESFGDAAPKAQSLSIDGEIKKKMSKIMGSYYKLPETQFWLKDGKSAWILEEIGKFEPITAGFVIGKNNKLERVKVLIYRESHGWEVKHEFFTRQFKGAGLKREKKLDQRIDGISGATLSVNALKRLSALALMFHKEITKSP